MKKIIKICMLFITIIMFSGCKPVTVPEEPTVEIPSEEGQARQSKWIRVIEKMPDIIPEEKYVYKDYGQTAVDLNRVLFEFADDPKGSPTYIGGFFDTNGKTSFGIDAYVRNIKTVQSGAGEAVAQMPAVLSSLLMGIDKTNETWNTGTYDFVEMLNVFYNEKYSMVTNDAGGEPNSEFWYMLYPQTLYCRIYDQVKDKPDYQNAAVMKENIIKMADNYVKMLPYFVDKDGNPNFDYTSFDFDNWEPVTNGQTEVPNHAIAFVLYAAYTQTNDQTYLDAMKSYMDWINDFNKNPNYEVMTDWGPSMAAIMNFKYDTNYDVEKFMNWLFDGDSDSRGAWGVINGTWGEYAADGLAGSISDHGGYGFKMNTFNMGGTLATTAKYDPRFSTAIGKWFLNASNNARMFYPLEMPSEDQSSYYMLLDPDLKDLVNPNGRSFVADSNGALGYEGVMKEYEMNNRSPFAVSDSWRAGLESGHGGAPSSNPLTDFCIYGSANVGIFGTTISQTDVSQILQIDLNKNDAFQEESYPQFLYYNPYPASKEIKPSLPAGSSLFDINSKTMIALDIDANTKISIPAKESLNIVVLPKDVSVKHVDHLYLADDSIIAKDSVSISITDPDKQRLPVSNKVTMNLSYTSPEPFHSMLITATTIAGNQVKIIYSGEALSSYVIDTEEFPNGLTNIIASIETQSGLKDQSSIKINIYNEGEIDPEDLVISWSPEEIANFQPATIEAPGAAVPAENGWVKIIMGDSQSGWGSTVKSTDFVVDFDRAPVVNFVIQNPTNAWCLKYRLTSDDESTAPGYWGEYLVRDTTGEGLFSIDMNEVLGEAALEGEQEIQLNLYNIGNTPDTSFEIKHLNVVYQ